ncbi:MAG TPA: alpha/beta fold hydrolase [Magnetospirillaceae bacterium]|jgi:pimeloyl-ACP methyl ester carboxylesterase
MTEPILLVPGLACSPRLYAEQLPVLWRFGPLTIADPTHDDSIAAIAARILAEAPQRFALIGLSMGGYIAFEIMRQAPDRVIRLALLDTSARPDLPEATERRHRAIALVNEGRYADVTDGLFQTLVHPEHRKDERLRGINRQMADDVGPEAYIRQQTAVMNRADSRPTLAAIRCPTLVLVGDGDQITPPRLAQEMAAGIAGATLVTVPECGHLSTLEQPEAVNQALAEWMGRG